ncbi:MAG: hypothetical protein E7639_00990 [Ruminococcaceae bacterium]|nr:hypothetical protein [Oscillospiraceae bacterium]
MRGVAKVIRGITVPPAVVAVLLILLWCMRADVIGNAADFWLSLLFLAVVPVLAYPLQRIIPVFRAQGQRGARKLAFILSFCGYTAAVVISLVRGAVPNLAYIAAVYLCSVLVLTAINVFTPWHASGHACSMVGPVALLGCFFGLPAILVGILVVALSFWASVYLKRHTVREYFLGALSPILAGVLMYPVFWPTF